MTLKAVVVPPQHRECRVPWDGHVIGDSHSAAKSPCLGAFSLLVAFGLADPLLLQNR